MCSFESEVTQLNFVAFTYYLCRWKVVEGGEGAETARDVGEHVEGNNGGSIDAVKQAHEEV